MCRRLEAYYGPEASLDLWSGPTGRGAISRLRIPVPSAVPAGNPSTEGRNPTGSVKDRVAKSMIDAAEAHRIGLAI